jgi:hypothetical protein
VSTPKRFLVVVRAGDHSLHPQWTSDFATRKWDLVVSYFGEDPDRFRSAGEIRIDDRGQKYGGLHTLLTRQDFWRNYEYIWLPDDDLAAEQSAIDELFEIMAQMDLALAQPALSWTSFFSYVVTVRNPSFRLRLTNFVEVMAPCFHRPFLETCVPTFTENLSGWGLSWLWPRLLPAEPRRCAIVDQVQVTHTRPVGGPIYDRLREAGITPRDELEELKRKFGIPPDMRPRVYAAIDGEGNRLDAADVDGAARMRELLARDRAAFIAFSRARQRGSPDAAASLQGPVDEVPERKWRQ